MCIRDSIYGEQVATVAATGNKNFNRFMGWADAARQLLVMTNADNQRDAQQAVSYTHLDVYKRQGVARGLTAAGVELDQFLRHLLGGFFYLGAGALPLGTAQLCQLYLFLVAGGGVAAQQGLSLIHILFTYDRAEIKPDANAVRSVNAALAAEFAKVTR